MTKDAEGALRGKTRILPALKCFSSTTILIVHSPRANTSCYADPECIARAVPNLMTREWKRATEPGWFAVIRVTVLGNSRRSDMSQCGRERRGCDVVNEEWRSETRQACGERCAKTTELGLARARGATQFRAVTHQLDLNVEGTILPLNKCKQQNAIQVTNPTAIAKSPV